MRQFAMTATQYLHRFQPRVQILSRALQFRHSPPDASIEKVVTKFKPEL